MVTDRRLTAEMRQKLEAQNPNGDDLLSLALHDLDVADAENATLRGIMESKEAAYKQTINELQAELAQAQGQVAALREKYATVWVWLSDKGIDREELNRLCSALNTDPTGGLADTLLIAEAHDQQVRDAALEEAASVASATNAHSTAVRIRALKGGG